ncbi:DDE-type integrase/transposase/recombinase [Clostridium sp. JS66]|uniref:DDE-type integrase/transposase/recombinase n=1 Tax=Clostridium sp. JS66 TaxID=3064705 RepID=UPI00298E32C8|nr:DDE-type integrase/transposase/recombinase [Clostridium sp. JS66]WPC39760.1 DDE-type integrase/transposase/recombinase [Clostridium sp. JS66]WPC39905.1 DDE-type integrase/transposase/recombinase [Clostridium sp. JS66]WPC39970.1 DDE-type integrase/transposase/recombinase [Clostridium sp. JS66]WPC40263.1 DDE-type integrase/transposase/recombinase [Clostridium sp. JS66]WPC40532.1 DDE-type integrase/transposase/recombinase [Clostridium sp. JS66]
MISHELSQKIALFRYSLIAPIITNTFTQSSVKEYLSEIAAKSYTMPNGGRKEYSPATIKGWLTLYRKHGIDGLYPKTRDDKGCSRKISQETKQFIINCKINSPKKTAKHIYHEVIAKGFENENNISLSTITRFIKQANIAPQKLAPQDRRAFEFEYANECWQSDVSVGPYLTIQGRKYKTYIIAFLDDASRLIVGCKVFFKDDLLSLMAVFKDAVASKGIPKKVFVDNGKIYKSEQFQLICASLGSILSFARPYSPQSKGKIERWFQTMQKQWMNSINWGDFKSIDILNESLLTYVNHYNKTFHSSINSTPFDKYMNNIENLRFVSSKSELDHLFLYKVQRTVKNDSTVSIGTKLFEVPLKYVREKINIRYDPTSLDKAYIFSEDAKLTDTIFPLKKIDNSKVRRSNNDSVDFSAFKAN